MMKIGDVIEYPLRLLQQTEIDGELVVAGHDDVEWRVGSVVRIDVYEALPPQEGETTMVTLRPDDGSITVQFPIDHLRGSAAHA